MAARLDGSGPLYETRFAAPSPQDIATAFRQDTVGGVLRALRLAHGLTQAEAGAAIDCNRETIIRCENGRNRRNSWMAGLCALWGTTWDEVMFGERLRRSALDGPLSARLADWISINGLSWLEASIVTGASRWQLLRIAEGEGVRPGVAERVEARIESCRDGYAGRDTDGAGGGSDSRQPGDDSLGGDARVLPEEARDTPESVGTEL